MEAAPYKLYSPGQVAGATFFGGPIAGAWLMATNFQNLGAPSARRTALVWGWLGTIALCVLVFFLPERFPNAAIPISCTLGLYQFAKKLQGEAFGNHVAAGGRHYSGWRVVGIGLVCLVAQLAILTLVLLLLPKRYLAE